jgi:hypothetical protein
LTWIKLPPDVVLLPEATVPDRRPVNKGSFGGHLEELVKHFPHEKPVPKSNSPKRTSDRSALQEKIDIHALLFQMAWQVDRDEPGS